MLALQTHPGSSPLETFGAALTGWLAGCLLGWAVAAALSWRNLRGSFALPLALVGYVTLVELREVFYGWALLGGGLVGAFVRASWRRSDLKAGGEASRTAREALTVRAFAATWWERRGLARDGELVDRGRYALGLDNRRGVVWLPLGLQGGRHALLIGATGTGKTTTMLWALLRHLDAGFGAVVIDAKGDPELLARCRAEALWRARPFYCFSLDAPCQPWNPLTFGSPSERADKLIAAEEWTEPHYKRLYQRYLLAVFTALDAADENADLAIVLELLNPERLALFCRKAHDQATGERVSDYVAELTQEERRDLAGLRNRLALLAESEHGELLSPTGDPAEEIDLLLAINQRALVVFSLNSSRYPETAKLLGAALFQDLKHVAGTLHSHPELARPAAVVVDEFGAFGADHVVGLFQRARSAGLSLLLATQELADLRRVDPAFQDQVLGNVETIVAHRQNVPDSAELIAGIAGTREVWEHTFQTDERWNHNHARGQSGLGTKRHGHQFIVPPDTIKQLRTGQAVVIQKEPHTAKRAAIFTPSPPELPGNGQDAVLEAALRRTAFERMYPPEAAPDDGVATAGSVA
jgi:hypothetical protein